jgi:CRP/FNR family transcriptional regulator, cyclic AMP receptor protein
MSTEAIISEVPIFSLLDDQEREDLIKLLKPRHFSAGQRIFRTGDPAVSLYVIRTGLVRVLIETDEGEEVHVMDLEPGDVVGEVSFLDGGPRTASAEVAEDAELLEFDRSELLKFITGHPHAAIDLLTVMGQRLRKTDQLLRTRVSRNANEEQEEMLTLGDRVADRVASFGGSWTFIFLFGAILLVWITVNSVQLLRHPFDPYPYILLNLFLSMLAAIQAPVIMMSQNRQAEKDRLRNDLDYQVNMKAELEIIHLHRKVDQIYEIMQDSFTRLGCGPGGS